MPLMDGLELSERLLSRKKVKIIFFSGYQDFDYVRKALRNGCLLYTSVAGKKYIFLRFHIKPQPGGFRHPAEQVSSCLFIPNQAFHIVEYGAAKCHVPLVSPQYMLLHLHPIIPSGRKLQCPPQNISGLQRTAESAESRCV